MEQGSVQIGMKAPNFTAATTHGPITLSDYQGRWVILFSHPGDFTPVCTTEFLAFAQAAGEFAAKNTQLIGLSIDSNPSHLAWVHAIYQTTGVVIPFPIIADRVGEVARRYGMIAPEVSTQETVRNVYFIDPQQIIRAILCYPMTSGRSIPEVLRLLTAMQTADQQKVVTPANWQPGQPTMTPAPQTYSQLVERTEDSAALGLECKAWFWCYHKGSPRPQNQQNTLQTPQTPGTPFPPPLPLQGATGGTAGAKAQEKPQQKATVRPEDSGKLRWRIP